MTALDYADDERPSGVYSRVEPGETERLIAALERCYADACLYDLPGAMTLIGTMIDGLGAGLGVKSEHAAMLRTMARDREARFPGTALARVYGGASREVDAAGAEGTSSRRDER